MGKGKEGKVGHCLGILDIGLRNIEPYCRCFFLQKNYISEWNQALMWLENCSTSTGMCNIGKTVESITMVYLCKIQKIVKLMCCIFFLPLCPWLDNIDTVT